MSNISNNPSNNAAILAIEDAIGKASVKICRKIGPGLDGDPLIQDSHDFYRKFFAREAAKMNHRILNNQSMPDVISYAGTLGWLHGFSCARRKAESIMKEQNKKYRHAYNDLSKENKKLNKLKSTDKGKLYRKLQWAKYCCLGLAAALVVAIVIIVIDSQMMG